MIVHCPLRLWVAFHLVLAFVSSAFGTEQFKNIIMLIPDGCDDAAFALARWYKGENLKVDELERGTMLAKMANSIIADSAPGGTALSAGVYSTDNFIAIGPRTEDLLSIFDPSDMIPPYAPVATVLEAAHTLHMSTGMISTSRLSHATPAAYSAHVDERSKEDEITLHQVHNNIDVMMGGGRRDLLPGADCPNADPDGNRADCRNLEKELLKRGYEFCRTADEMDQLEAKEGQKVWCSFAVSHMAADIDRQHFAKSEPSLAEMTVKALEILSLSPKGFFLMVEGAQPDWAGHANDPVWMATDIIAFDDAVKVAVDFAEQDGDTLVLAMPDHNCGGLKIGNYLHEYTDRTVEDVREPLQNMKMTVDGIVASLGVPPDEATADDLKKTVAENWGIELTEEELKMILEYSDTFSGVYESSPRQPLPLSYGLGRIFSERYTIAGWTSHGHSGENIPMWVYGMDPPKHLIENVDVGKMVARAMGVNLTEMTAELFVDLDTTDLDYTVNTSDPTDPFATVQGFVFPLGTDYFLNDEDERVMLPGVTIYAPMTKKLYISEVAIQKLDEMKSNEPMDEPNEPTNETDDPMNEP